MATIPDDYIDLLDKRVFWHIATSGPDGALQSSPVWGGFDDGHFVFSLTKGRQKFRNLQADPTIAVSGTDPENPYRYLEIRGKVVRVDDDSSNAFIDSMAKKYMDVDAYPFHQPGDERVVMRVEPTHTTQMG
ncbi:MAG: PPOX class F420-dependent oxidoreductase [Ilumatobacter sp.]|uniref:PPOX class F420-dependent oxidoreductase n=1 Tax=Ilumatobacter sp. TaxID=1967498 RepID=UPI002607DEE6|nr:PPOX class F420-dependent oxidoreductase [Ilumatobacter sp.]MDJ0771396.1 PPOX class F420-dependent oxidoreductase [Ilumatobacter sp.]